MLFRLCEISKTFYCLQRVPLQFFDISQQMDAKKSQKVPPLRFFGTMRLFKFLIFTRNQKLWSRENSLGFSALSVLSEAFFEKKIEKFVPNF